MPVCAAVGCRSRSGGKVSLYTVPPDTDGERGRRERWIHFLKRENPPKDFRVCALHFTEDQFEVDMKVCCFRFLSPMHVLPFYRMRRKNMGNGVTNH